MKSILTYFAFATALILTTLSCEKEPTIITETVTVIDTLVLTQTDTITLTDTVRVTEFIQDSATTFFIVKHAEKDSIGNNPMLTPDGQERAVELARILKNISINAIYSTNYFRTKLTAAPTAMQTGLMTNIYDPFSPETVADDILENFPKGKILLVGHSNTAPDFVNALLGRKEFDELAETSFDNLFIVSVFERGNAEVVHLKYGKPTP